MGGRAFLGFIGALVLLTGYQVGWYGMTMLRGLTGPGVQGGIAFLDLLVPKRNADGSVDAKLAGGGPPTASGAPEGQLPGGQGGIVQPGSPVGNPGQNYINV